MSPQIIFPSPRLRSKYRLSLWLSLLLMLLWMIPIGLAVGAEEGSTTGALIGLLIMLGLNVLWFVPTYWLIDRYVDSIRYEIHEDEVVVHVGIFTRSVKHVPFRTVTNISIKRDLFDRFLFEIGTVEIQTAGASAAQTGAEEALVGLVDFEGVYGIVAESLRRFRRVPMSPTQGVEGGMLAGEAEMGALLAEVRAIRSLLAERQPPGTGGTP